nr:energy-coupling factor transporter ATPase [Bifidobacterium leontopitheci]
MLSGVRFSYDRGATWALEGVDLTIQPGEWLCLTGRNGSGKSTLSRLIAGLAAPDEGDVTLLGRHVFDGETRRADAQAYRDARHGIGAVFQNPEDQIVTTVVEDDVAFGPENLGVPRDDIGSRIGEALQAVDMAGRRYDDPTRMSGGQQQRIAIAGMLAMRPRMLVLDEPTAMLDETARADVMRILARLHADGTTIVLVTHHMEETAHADRVVRLEAGRVVEEVAQAATEAGTRRETTPTHCVGAPASGGGVRSLRAAAKATAPDSTHETTTIHAIGAPASGGGTWSATAETASGDGTPQSAESAPAAGASPAIVVERLSYRYEAAGPAIIDDLSLQVGSGETVAVMGPNGAGKSTLARLLCALERPSAGSITVAGLPVASANRRSGGRPRMLTRKQREALRREVGYVMQHPERQLFAETVAEDVAYGPRNQHLAEAEVHARVDEALRLLHIGHLAGRSPFALSGGQQRLVAIAGVIACRPQVLIMDEATASLDAEATARIHELVRTLRSRGVTVVMITHSRREAELLADRIIELEPVSCAGEAADGTHDTDAAHPAYTVQTVDTVQTAGAAPAAGTMDATGTDGETASGSRTDGGEKSRGSQARGRAHRPSFVAAWDPRVKMVSVLALMFTAFAIVTPWQLAAGFAMTACVIAAARLRPLRLLASVHMFLIVFAVMGAVNVFFVRSGSTLAQWGPLTVTSGGVMVAVLYSCRLAMVIVLGAVFLATTTPIAMTDAFESLLSPLRRFGWHTQEVALVMSLALRFLPTLGDEVRSIIDAQSARGGSIETGSPTRRIRAMVAIIVPVFAGALRHADNLSLALDARCYEEGARRTHWRAMRVRGSDIAAGVLCVAYITALLLLRLL